MHYIAYLDEFGHIGPYVSRHDPRHKTSPVFGLGGMVLPADRVRSYATWFYQLKCRLLAYEIEKDGVPPYQWEKKGAALYTTRNVLTYRDLRQATFSILNRIQKDGGFVFYVGIQKNLPVEQQNPKGLYRAVLREAIKRLDSYCKGKRSQFQIILDKQDSGRDFRDQIVAEASRQMFGKDRTTMIEPPIEAESHLFQTLQCADWLCGLIGRFGCHEVRPDEYPELDWTTKYFSDRLKRVTLKSGIRHERPEPAPLDAGTTLCPDPK